MEKDVDKRDGRLRDERRNRDQRRGKENGGRRGSSLRRRFHESSHFNVR